MSELEDNPMDQESSGAKFARIGTHCHEFAHTLGIKHSSGSRADLMEAGNRNGNYAAPAPLNPIARMRKGWLTPNTQSGQHDLYYSLTAPQVFKIDGNVTGEYFLIENRRFDQTMTIGSDTIPDYNNKYFMPIAQSQNSTNVYINEGILVWRVTYNFPNQNYQDNGLIYASGRYNRSFPDSIATETDAGDPFPGTANVRVLSPWSDSRDPYSTSSGAPNNIFVPNTKSSTNVGMEVLSENSEGGYFTVMLYESSPQDAAPSMVQNFHLASPTGLVQLAWTANVEPDLSCYEVTRRLGTSGQWYVIGNPTTNSFTDYDYGITETMQTLYYRVRSKDTQNKYSEYAYPVSVHAVNLEKKPGTISLALPLQNELGQSFPNPFNPSTTISYQLTEIAQVSLKIYNSVGQEVATLVEGEKNPGYYSVDWNASNMSSGLYFYRFVAGKFSDVKKMLLMK